MRLISYAAISLCLLLIAACGGSSGEALGEVGQMVTASGQVESVDLSEMAVDGPGRITLQSEQHGLIRVVLPACEGPCAPEATERMFEMEAGQRWRATGELQEDGSLLVVDDDAHALERLE